MSLAVPVMSLALLAAGPAHAQRPTTGRLPSGLLGGGVGDTEQSLGLSASFGGGANSTVNPLVGAVRRGSTFGHVAGNLAYSLSRQRVQLWAAVNSSRHYYSGAAQQFPARHVANAGGNFVIPVSGRTALTLFQRATYEPLQIVSPFPGLVESGLGLGQALPIDPDLATTSDGYLSYSGGASLARELSRRSAMSVQAGYEGGGRLSATGDVLTGWVGGQFTRQLARGLGARLGYRYTRGTYSNGGQIAQFDYQNIDAGVDFNRALSLTRRTTLSFATGSTVTSDGVRNHFRVTGNARLGHDISRSWRASASFRRDVGFVGTLRAPVFSDSLAAGVNGLLGRSFRVHAAVGAALGEVGLGQGNNFRSYYGTTGIAVGLSQYVGVDVTYAYFRSNFASAALLAPGVPARFDRQSVRASVRLWAPLINRARRTNVTR